MGRLQQRLGVLDIRNADYRKPADSHFALYEALVSSSPLWVFASIYAVLGLLIIFTGLSVFEKTENVLAVIKTAAYF